MFRRGEGVPSPFLFPKLIFFIFRVGFTQYGTEDWLHPSANFFAAKDTSNHIQIYNSTHIGLINFNDSLHITEKKYGIKYIKEIENCKFRFNYNKYHSIIEFKDKDYLFSIQNIYNETLLGYEIKKGSLKFDVNIIKYSQIDELSPSVLISIELRPQVIGRFGKSIQKVPFQFSMNYTDFTYSLNNINTDHKLYYYGITFNNKIYQIDYLIEEDNWGISSNDSSFSALELETGTKRNTYLDGVFYLNKKKKINWAYYQRISQTALDFINSSTSTLVKINVLKNENHVFLLNYHFILPKYLYNISVIRQKSDFVLSSRIYPSRINNDLKTFFLNGTNIDNTEIGLLKQNVISVSIKSLKSSFCHLTFQLDWVRDNYDVNLDTKGYSIGIPTYTNNQTLNIIGKEAINLGFGLNWLYNNWLIYTSFSQHIPYKIDFIEKIIPEKEKKEEIYGGGLLKFSLTRYLN